MLQKVLAGFGLQQKIRLFSISPCFTFSPPLVLIPSRNFAARKGTRTRKEKKKVKKEEVKKVFMFKNLRKEMEQTYKKQRPFDDSHYRSPVDDVYLSYKFISIHYPFAEAIKNLREVNHPTVYNLPDAPISLKVHIDLTYPNRPNKLQDGWRSVIEMKAPFTLEGMIRPTVLAFCPEDNDQIAEVLKAGADVAGSKEIIKAIQEGEISAKDFEYIVAHPVIVPDLSAIRGLIKRSFPTIRNKTISTDLVSEVKRLKSGVKIGLQKSDREPDYGFFEIPIGTLNMTTEELESNFLSVLRDTLPRRVSGKDPGKFVIDCVIRALHEGRQREHFKIDLTPYMEEFRKQKSRKVEEEEDTDLVKDEDEEGKKEKSSAIAS